MLPKFLVVLLIAAPLAIVFAAKDFTRSATESIAPSVILSSRASQQTIEEGAYLASPYGQALVKNKFSKLSSAAVPKEDAKKQAVSAAASETPLTGRLSGSTLIGFFFGDIFISMLAALVLMKLGVLTPIIYQVEVWNASIREQHKKRFPEKHRPKVTKKKSKKGTTEKMDVTQMAKAEMGNAAKIGDWDRYNELAVIAGLPLAPKTRTTAKRTTK